jgi:integrase
MSAAKPPIKLTKSVVEKLPVPEAGQEIYRDSELKGFGLRITRGGTRAYIVERRIDQKVRRVKLGKSTELSAEQARKRAQEHLGKVAGGRNPIAERRAAAAQTVTLGELLERYLGDRSDKLKPRTREQYRSVVEGRMKAGTPTAFADWCNKRVIDITVEMVRRRHRELSEQHGPAWANLAMRILRLLLNYAVDAGGEPLVPQNPVKRLGQARLWNEVKRRQTMLCVEDMPAWYEALGSIDEMGRDYLLLVLLTGLRRREATTLQRTNVDLVKTRTLTVRDTKNGTDHILPLSKQLLEILERRLRSSTSKFVFPGRKPGTCLTEPRNITLAVERACGVRTSVHDLRRTFATAAERLDISSYAVKRLLNHQIGSDVTAGYIVADIERLRRPMQQISDFLLRAMGAADPKIASIREAARAAG